MIQGYTLATFPKVTQYILCTTREETGKKTLHMVLVSDTSKIACGSALYQEQKGRYRLIAYFSKILPLSAQRYSINELELTGIYANITAFKYLLRNSNFTLQWKERTTHS